MSKNSDIKDYLEKLAFVSNEISTPISHISGMIQIIDMLLDADTINVDEIKDCLKIITKNCDMHERTVNNIVSYCYPPVHDLKLLKIKDFAEKFSTGLKPYAAEYGFDFKYKLNITDDEFNLPVLLLEKILLGLIVNSVQYNSKSQKKVSLTITQLENELVFTVKDNGDGIKEENLTKVTEEFFRENSSKHSGLGYGLPLIKKAIEALNGKLEIKSIEKKGTEITFSIPQKTNIQLRSSTYEYKPSPSFFRSEFSALYNKNY